MGMSDQHNGSIHYLNRYELCSYRGGFCLVLLGNGQNIYQESFS